LLQGDGIFQVEFRLLRTEEIKAMAGQKVFKIIDQRKQAQLEWLQNRT
jgi:hypothetical protein